MSNPAAEWRAPRRTVNTCMRCRRLKLKCDHAQPCASCVRSSTTAECKYPTDLAAEDRERERERKSTGTQADAPAIASSSFSSPDAEDSTPVRKRRRAVRVCARCRRLKLKCDQGAPCSSCTTSGTDSECVYARGPTPDVADDRERELAELQARIKVLEGQLGAPYPSPHSMHMSPSSATDVASASASGFSVVSGSGGPLSRVPLLYELDLGSILALFPPAADTRRLLASFAMFDLLFRLVHMPSFMRKAERVLTAVAAAHTGVKDGYDVLITDVAMVVAALVCGATIYVHGNSHPAVQHDPETHDARASENHLRALLELALNTCDARYMQLPPVDFVHAHLLGSYTYMAGLWGGPQRGWLASGRAYHAALLVGINKDKEDRVDETMFDREIRRRVWWHVINSRITIASRLRIEVPLDPSKVPRPLNITDVALEELWTAPDGLVLPARRETLTEWSYIDSKLDVLAVIEKRDAIMSRTNVPLLERLKTAHAVIDEYAARVPKHQIGDHAVMSNLPSWAQMQARVSDITIAELYVHLYRPYFGTTGDEVGVYALSQGIQATQHMVRTVKALSQNVLFGWLDLDAPTFALWTCGMRSFTAGLVLAYALMADPDNAAAPALMADFEAMIAIVRSRRAVPHTAQSNEHALSTLQQLHRMIKSKDHSMATLQDPYTGKALDMPLILPDFAVGEWDQWETLFQELFHDGIVPV